LTVIIRDTWPLYLFCALWRKVAILPFAPKSHISKQYW